MRFTASAKELGDALENAMACAEKRTTIPILTHVLVEAWGEEVAITASDLDREVRLTVPAQVQKGGSEAIDGAMFRDFVKRVKGSDVILESHKGAVKLTSGRAKAEIPTLPYGDFPSLGRGAGEEKYLLEGTAFQKAIAGVSIAASSEETRYYLCGVYMHANAGKWVAVSTDGHRLHKIELSAPGNGHTLPPVIIPTKSVQLAGKLFREAERITLFVSPSRIVITTDSATLNSKLIDGSFPDYLRVIPRDQSYRIKTSREDLIAAIGRAAVAADSAASIKFALAGGVITVSGSKDGKAWSSDEVDADCGVADFEIGATAKYLLDALEMLEGEEVEMSLSDSSSQFVFRDAHEGTLAVVMPRRV
jgi:DNA polymerase III subunit beta